MLVLVVVEGRSRRRGDGRGYGGGGTLPDLGFFVSHSLIYNQLLTSFPSKFTLAVNKFTNIQVGKPSLLQKYKRLHSYSVTTNQQFIVAVSHKISKALSCKIYLD